MAKSIWTIDSAHSEIGFKVKHMMFTNVSGKFNEFQATIENEDDRFETSKILFSAQVNSIDTSNIDRDNHLRSADFFDAESFPIISFQSTGINKINENVFGVSGNLTIKNITKNVTFEIEYSGLMKDPWENIKVAISLSGKINRKEFGLTWNTSLEAGGVLVGEDTKLTVEMQFIKQ